MKRCIFCFKIILFCYIFLVFNISSFAYGSFSFGISLGNPTGLSLKIQQRKDFVYDFVTNFATNPQYLYLHCDFLKYNYEKITSKELTGKLPIFYGIGLKFENTKNTTNIGLRFVCGIEYIFADIPFEIFFKVAPYIEIFPLTAVGIAPSIGIRYIFK